MEKVVIYRAADAFLYLPAYIAEHTDVFKKLNIDIRFQTAESLAERDTSTGGDHLAIKNMIDNKHENGSCVPIALCDPMAIFANPHFSQFNQPENLKVIGTLIDKPPFWAVSIRDEKFNTMEGTARHFDGVIYYKSNRLVTGNYIGKLLERESGLSVLDEVNLGEEIDRLLGESETSRKFCVAVTVDIIRLAQSQHSGKKVYLNYRFSEKFDKFLTSCLITTAEVCEMHSDTITKVLEGIQRSIFMFRTSERIARDVCQIVNSQIIEKGTLKYSISLKNKDDPDTILEQWCHEKFSDPIIENQKSGCSWLVVDTDNGERYLAEEEEDQIHLYESSGSLTEEDITWIVNQFHEENFYPNDLITPEDKWKASIEARSRAQYWEEPETEKYKEKYNEIVDNQFAYQAQNSIIKEISGMSPQEVQEDFARREEEMMDKLATHKKKVEENFARHKNEIEEDFARREEEMMDKLATHKKEVEENFARHKEVHLLLGSIFLLSVLLSWFPGLPDEHGPNRYEQMIKISLSGLFGLVFIFKIVFWNKGWFYICAAAGVVIILGGVVYFFWGLGSSIISGVISGVILLLISRKFESLGRNSDK